MGAGARLCPGSARMPSLNPKAQPHPFVGWSDGSLGHSSPRTRPPCSQGVLIPCATVPPEMGQLPTRILAQRRRTPQRVPGIVRGRTSPCRDPRIAEKRDKPLSDSWDCREAEHPNTTGSWAGSAAALRVATALIFPIFLSSSTKNKRKSSVFPSDPLPAAGGPSSRVVFQEH